MNDIETAYRELNDKVRKLERHIKQVGDSMMALEIAIDEIRHRVKVLGDVISLSATTSEGDNP